MGLHVGGDDYIPKPYSLSVLLAKIQAMLKRYGQKEEATTLSVGDLQLDEQAGKVYVQKQEITLSNMEYKLLQYMMHHVGELLRKEQLFEDIWGSTYTQDGTLNVHIRHLREKIERDPQRPEYIKTIWGSGYRLEEPKR